MSGLINKVKEAIHSDKKDNVATNDPHSSNAGPHGSNVANKVDPRVDSDRDNLGTTGGYGSTTTGGTGAGLGTHGAHGTPGTHGTHGTPGTHGTHGTPGTHGTHGAPITQGAHGTHGTTTTGPHSSNISNKVDPRVDSDRDGSRNLGAAGNTGYGNTGTTGAGYGSTHTGTTGAGYGSGTTGAGYDDPRSANQGPHSSNLANKLDPRVDNTYGSSNTGAGYGTGATGATTGAGYGSGTTGAGYGGHGNPQSTNAGPHSSNIGNTVDPRIDSDLDSSRRTGHGDYSGHNTGAGGLGSTHTSGTQGGLGSSHTSSATHGGHGASHTSHVTPGSGTATGTAGPHNSDLLNKLDPRVDSNRDGSKTVGGDATYR